ncbi:hypothetical protein ACQPYK_00160 [Streptosporangium sp. CA-135522]|uniref:hypothetical protein n=1 Tax=Streptosporangium sp. CA-135522 TaxID=3240072 RepID=UPI003D8B083A
MDVRDPDGPDSGDLVMKICALLDRAGFNTASSSCTVPYDMQVRYDPGRGVALAWNPTFFADASISNMAGRYRGIRTAVHLAAMSVVIQAGYHATYDAGIGEALITGRPATPDTSAR